MKKKKGISPLIASVLLIGFTVALIAIVLIWGRNYLEEIQQKEGGKAQSRLSCVENVLIDVKSIEEKGNKITATVENKAGDVDGFVFRVIGASGTSVVEKVNVVKSGEVKDVEFEYESLKTGPILEKVEVIPRLRVGKGVYESCSQKLIGYKLEK